MRNSKFSNIENNNKTAPRVFITGVSDGLGLALAELYLKKGWTVFGLSRRKPDSLSENENFIFKSCDLFDLKEVSRLFEDNFSSILELGVSVIHLNAGVSGNAPARSEEYSTDEILETLIVNALSNKVILDGFLALGKRPDIVVASASVAGIRYRAGMLPYSMSKAALNALCGVYAQENPDVFFAVLGMCNVKTALSEGIVFNSRVPEFPEHIKLQNRFYSQGYSVSPEKRAEDIYRIIYEKDYNTLTSGEFIEIRQLVD